VRVKWKAYGRYGSVGFELVVSMIVGYLFGKWLDDKVGGGGWLTGIFSVAGVYAGFRAIFKAANQMTADIEKEEKLDRGESPWKVPMPEVTYDDDDDDDAPEEEGPPSKPEVDETPSMKATRAAHENPGGKADDDAAAPVPETPPTKKDEP
jgi:ATP synthase protein I